ncbi:MAG: hypothetical protein HYU24_01925 [Candidatus Rokubacteria bacterium]|nr:hypothetical protein [Candidatus Rokubacteria bacterium]
MADSGVLERLVAQVGWQIRRRRAEFYGLRGLFFGALLGLVPLLLKTAVGSAAPLIALGLALVGALAGALRGIGLPLPPLDAARLADRALALQDRVATALEWAGRPDRSPLVDLLVADVTARLEGVDGRGVVPRRWPRELKWLPLPAVLLVVLALAPSIPLPTGRLPVFSTSEDSETPEERAGKILTDERPKAAKREPLQRAEILERNLSARGGATGGSQPGDLAALFKDTALAAQRPDFQSFLKKGDERLRMLEQVDRLPDLKRDFTQSQYKMIFQKRKELFGGLRADQISPQKLRELMEEMERMGRKGGSWGGDIGEGMEALESGQTDRALEAMERALSKMRAMEERGRGGRGLRGGREERGRGGRGADRGAGGGDMEADFGEGEGLLPGKGRNPTPKGDPTDRLRANPFDAGVEGESRSGRKEGYETNLLGKGTSVPSRLQYLGVFGQYRKMMEEAMAREQVPRDYQSQVKEYFESLEERR